ncbi:hypothetical protein SKAU_G00381820 [Synaphobranchus kaupii]|uniref:Uncharacterized protein n=1 Tax=Synaphobranchus kaupii TaxID=118154 RepID=A0A9Q1IER1_SYNKA|nr:hypothetical protein SKAU_G00381820 [Synaphobranchus kaupii]
MTMFNGAGPSGLSLEYTLKCFKSDSTRGQDARGFTQRAVVSVTVALESAGRCVLTRYEVCSETVMKRWCSAHLVMIRDGSKYVWMGGSYSIPPKTSHYYIHCEISVTTRQ